MRVVLSGYRLAILGLFAVVSAFSQATTGQFGGTVTDASGGSVPNAKVTVANPATGAVRSVTTDQTGAYLVLQLPPGAYEVSAEAQGFKKEVQRGVDL